MGELPATSQVHDYGIVMSNDPTFVQPWSRNMLTCAAKRQDTASCHMLVLNQVAFLFCTLKYC